MGRDIGSHSFREELDRHAERLTALEGAGGGGANVVLRDEEGFELEITSLLIGAGLDADPTDVAQGRIRSGFRIQSNGEGFSFGPDEQLRGIQLSDGMKMENALDGEGMAIISALPQLQVDAQTDIRQINLGPGLKAEEVEPGVVTIDVA
jgi:hypothetical protein